MLSALNKLPPWLRWVFARRLGNAFGFIICAALLGYGYYLQFVMKLEPCPLCILQRVCLFGTGVLFLVAALHHPLKRWAAHLYGGLICTVALAGLSIASRHVWLQHTPESQRPACGPGLEFLFNTFGPLGSLQRILKGSGECGAVDWTFIGFSIPEWTLVCFLVLTIYAALLSFRD